jgi:hypothetical protein
VEDLQDPLLGAHQLKGTFVRVDASQAPDQNAQRSRIEEIDTLEVHYEVVVTFGDQVRELLPQARRRMHIELADDLDDGVDSLTAGRNREVHKSSIAQA